MIAFLLAVAGALAFTAGFIFAPELVFWWSIRCLWLPWHAIVTRWRLTQDAEKIVCRCGRAFGVNHGVRLILPWEDVRSLYEGPGIVLR